MSEKQERRPVEVMVYLSLPNGLEVPLTVIEARKLLTDLQELFLVAPSTHHTPSIVCETNTSGYVPPTGASKWWGVYGNNA